jgi:hypothetical protein
MAKYWKIVNRGTITSSEVFAHGHWLETDDAATLTLVTSAVASARAACFTTGYLGNYQTSQTWTGADIYQMDLQANTALDHGVSNVSYAGTLTGSSMMPLEVAMVLSLRTATLTRSGRGRMYLPSPGVNFVDANGLFTSGVRTAVTNAWKAYFDDFNTSVGWAVGVRGLTAPGGTTYVLRPITTIDVGSVPDAQRRRRNAQVETRTTATITP